MRIEVTQADIDAGMMSAEGCPVALAVRRQAGRRCLVTAVRFVNADGGRWVPPGEVSAFVHAFDSGRPVEPFAFDLPDDFLTPPGGGR